MQKFKRVKYADLSAKQQEIFNFQKAAGILADYGFNCIKLADDWHGADFLAYHKDGVDTLKVQLKGRMTIDRKYQGKGLHLAFPLAGGWCFVEHDLLIEIVGQVTNWLNTDSWTEKGQYHSGKPSQKLIEALKPYVLSSTRQGTIGQLFEVEPAQWALRGDSHLWMDMRAHFTSIALPESADELEDLIAKTFHELCGQPLETVNDIYVKDYDHGGMSGGKVSAQFWRERAVPLLLSRYAQA